MANIINIYRTLAHPLGGNYFGGRSTNWILTAAALAASVGSSIIGGAQASKAAKKAKREQAYRQNAENAWYTKEYNTDYLDTRAGQNLMRRAQDAQDAYIRKADGAAAVGGGTAASVAQAKEAANRTMGNTIANIAASDTSRKQHVSDAHLSNQMAQSEAREQTELTRAANVTSAAQGASNALMTAAGSLEGGAKPQSNNNLANTTTSTSNTNVIPPSQNAVVSNGALAVADATGASRAAMRPYADANQLRTDEAMYSRESFWKGLTR